MDPQMLMRLMAMQQQAQAPPKPACEFKAGMMNHETIRGTNKLRMAADPRKGMLTVIRDASDGSMHIKWIDRASGNMGMDHMVFPEDVSFKRINTGNATDRVYELKYIATANRCYYFWMQGAKAEDDEANVVAFLSSINNPPPAEGAGGEAGQTNPLARTPGLNTRRGGLGAPSEAAGAAGLDVSALSSALASFGLSTAQGSSAASPPPAAGQSAGAPAPAAAAGAPSASAGVPAPAPAPQAAPAADASEDDDELAEAIRLSMLDSQGGTGDGGAGGAGGEGGTQ